MPDSEDEIRRRMRAALALAGIKNVRELAERIDLPGLGRDTLYEMQSGKRAIRRHELREIADACGLPLEFFTVDFATLEENGSADSADRVLERLNEMDNSYREFIKDVRKTVVSTAGQIQNELDAARRAHSLPSQQPARADETRPKRAAGRRRKP